MTRWDWKYLAIIGGAFVLFIASAFLTTRMEPPLIMMGLAFAGVAVWGVRSGSTSFPRSGRTYSREEHPVSFWFTIALWALLGFAMVGGGVLSMDSSGRISGALAVAASRGLVIPAVIVGLVVLIVLVVAMSRNRATRPEQLAACARTLGFRLDATGASFNPSEWAELSLFAPDPDATTMEKRVRNVMTGRRDGLDIAVLEYEQRERTIPFACTAVCMRSRGMRLPALMLGAEGMGKEAEEIVFTDHPGFARSYSAWGKDRARVVSALTPAVLDFLAAQEGLVVDASGERVIVWRPGFVKPNALPALVEQGVTLVRLFSARR